MNKLIIFNIYVLLSFQVLSTDWSETSVSYLRGNDISQFNASDISGDEITFQHASGWSHGDNFIWLDWFDYYKSDSSTNSTALYGEWAPRFSLFKIFGKSFGDGLIKDILQSNTLEFGRQQNGLSRGRLHGVAVDFNIAGFDFFQVNFYHRDNPELVGTTFQTTLAYRKTFNLTAKFNFFWAAYIDIVHGDEGDRSGVFAKAHWHTAQQLLFDIGALAGFKKKTLYLGFEYQYWSTKFGVEGIGAEHNLKYMVSWFL